MSSGPGSGSRQIAPLIVLHGANSAAVEMRPLTDRMPPDRAFFAPNMLGHGGRSVPARLTLAEMGEDLLAQCDAAGMGAAHWFGYSVGGLVALWIAAHRPERVLSISTLVTKVIYDPPAVAHAVHLADPERLARPDHPRSTQLPALHHPQDWVRVVEAVRQLLASFGNAPPMPFSLLEQIRCPALLLGGLKDPLVPAAEVKLQAKRMPNAASAFFPGSSHPLASAPIDAIVQGLTDFTAEPQNVIRKSKISLQDFRWDRP